MAWARTSESECPSRPNSLGTVTPPGERPAGGQAVPRSHPNRCDLTQGWTSLRSLHERKGAPRSISPGLVILMLRSLPAPRSLPRPGARPCWPRPCRGSRLPRQLEGAGQPDRSGRPVASAPSPVSRAAAWPGCTAAGGAADLLHRVQQPARNDSGAGLGRFVEHLANVSGSMKGPTASWTATRGVSGPRWRARSRRLLRLFAAFHRAYRPAGKLPRQHRADPLQILRSAPLLRSRPRARKPQTCAPYEPGWRAFQQHELLAAGASLLGGALSHTGAQARAGNITATFMCITILSWFSRDRDWSWAAGRSCAPAGRASQCPPPRAPARRICRKSSFPAVV